MKTKIKLISSLSFAFIMTVNCYSQELVGTTAYGGDSNYGIIFSYNVMTDTYTKIFDFEGGFAGGKYPSGPIIQASNGRIYGMTQFGGIFDTGTLFEYSISKGTYTHYDLFYIDGDYPALNNLLEASNGKLYGLTKQGSISGFGILFEFDPNTKTLTRKISFGGIPTISGLPEGSLIQASNGKLYGMARLGGTNGNGAIYEYDIDTNSITVIHSFNEPDGRGPRSSLIQASNGKLYGMTTIGGSNSSGVIFEYDLVTSTYTKKFDFDTINGATPWNDLMEASNGKLYGMTLEGGSNNKGVLFEFDLSTDTFTKKVDLIGTNGSTSYTSLIEASNGKLYGNTNSGGVNNFGVVFEFDPSNGNYTVLKSLNGTSEGKWLKGRLVEVNQSLLNTANLNDKDAFKIYPNPTSRYLNLGGDLSILKSAEIYSISGQLISTIKSNFDKIDLSLLKPSLYFIRLNTLFSSETIKVIKQ